MPEIRKGQKDSDVEGGKKGAPTGEGRVKTVERDGSAAHQVGEVRTGRAGVNKELGKA